MAGKRYGILNEVEEEVEVAEEEAQACYFDAATGQRECS
jgi:hypothetical protein